MNLADRVIHTPRIVRPRTPGPPVSVPWGLLFRQAVSQSSSHLWRRGRAFVEDGLMSRYPNVFVPVSDGKPISEIIERADKALKRAGINSAKRRELARECRDNMRFRSITFEIFARRIKVISAIANALGIEPGERLSIA